MGCFAIDWLVALLRWAYLKLSTNEMEHAGKSHPQRFS